MEDGQGHGRLVHHGVRVSVGEGWGWWGQAEGHLVVVFQRPVHLPLLLLVPRAEGGHGPGQRVVVHQEPLGAAGAAGAAGAPVAVERDGVHLAGRQRAVRDDHAVEVVVVGVHVVYPEGRGGFPRVLLLLALVALHGLFRAGREGRHHGDGLREGHALAPLAQRTLGPADQDGVESSPAPGAAGTPRQRLVAVVNVSAVLLLLLLLRSRAGQTQRQVSRVAGVGQQRVPHRRRRRGRRVREGAVPVPHLRLPPSPLRGPGPQRDETVGDGGGGGGGGGGGPDLGGGAGVVGGQVGVGQRGHLQRGAVDGAVVVVVVVVVAAVGGEGGGLAVTDSGVEVEARALAGLLPRVLHPGVGKERGVTAGHCASIRS